MSRQDAIEALVLDVLPYRDNDLIVRLFSSQHGPLSAMAYSARRSRTRFPSGLDQITWVETLLEFKGRGMPTCKWAVTREAFWGIKSDLDKTCAAALLAELLVRSPMEPREAELLFDDTSEFLARLDGHAPIEARLVMCYVVIFLLLRLGQLPTPSCARCEPGQWAEKYSLRPDSGEVCCHRHSHRPAGLPVLSADDLRLMQELAVVSPAEFFDGGPPSASSAPLFRALQARLGSLFAAPFKSLAFMESLS